MSDNIVKKRDLQSWIEYLEKIDPSRINMGLDRVDVVARKMQVKNFTGKTVITVAGTNGKVSTCAFIANCLYKSGIKVGMYTSPHLLKVNERIVINQKVVGDMQLAKAFDFVYENSQNIDLTYYEFITLAALYLFKREDVDVLVLEVGLGGRLDAVNIVNADYAVITSIAFDHTEYLGNTLEQIAIEKSGIIKQDKSVIIGPVDPQVRSVIEHQAFLKNAHVYAQSVDFVADFSLNNGKFRFSHSIKNDNSSKVSINSYYDLPKIPYIIAPLALFIVKLLIIKGIKITESAIVDSINNASMPCRMEKLCKAPSIYIDVAHNVQAASYLKVQLNMMYKKGKRFAVIAMLKDKDYEGVISALATSFDEWYVASTQGTRALSCSKLAQAITNKTNVKDKVKAFDSIDDALEAAIVTASNNDDIIVFGSFVTASAALNYLSKAKM